MKRKTVKTATWVIIVITAILLAINYNDAQAEIAILVLTTMILCRILKAKAVSQVSLIA